jgi:hypothetical protein
MSRPVLPRQLVKLHADLPRKSMRRLTGWFERSCHSPKSALRFTPCDGEPMTNRMS